MQFLRILSLLPLMFEVFFKALSSHEVLYVLFTLSSYIASSLSAFAHQDSLQYQRTSGLLGQISLRLEMQSGSLLLNSNSLKDLLLGVGDVRKVSLYTKTY